MNSNCKSFWKWLLVLSAAGILYGCDGSETELPQIPPIKDEEDAAEALDAIHLQKLDRPYPKENNDPFLNPCPLLVPSDLKTGVSLQFALSRSADFPDETTEISAAVPWCMFNPHRELETGDWYWRFRNVDAAGVATEWSEAYRFCMRDDTPRFVTPPFETFLDNIPRRHPRLYCFLDDGLEAARQHLPQHSEYKQLIKRANNSLTVDYTGTNPYNQASQIGTYMYYLYEAYHMTQENKYADKMAEILQIILDYPATDDDLFASSYTAADCAIPIILAYDILYDRLTATRRATAENILFRITNRYSSGYIGRQECTLYDNHFWQHIMRIMFQCAFMLYDTAEYGAEAERLLAYYYELWTARAPDSGLNRSGGWRNGIGYFDTNVETLFYMPSLFSGVTGTDFLQHPWYLNSGQAVLFSWPPDSRGTGFGDASEGGESPVKMRVIFADFIARALGDPYAGWYASQCSQWMNNDYRLRLYRLVHHESYGTELPENTPKYVWYKDIGEVVMHSDMTNMGDNLSLSFRSSPFGSGSHTLADQNAFNLQYQGKIVYKSTGYYLDYSDAHNLMSYRHTRAHNTLLVNGIGQPFSTKGYGCVLRAMGGDNITYCLGDASHAYSGISDDPKWVEAFEAAGITQTPENGFGPTPLTRYKRHVLILPPNTVILYDDLEASEPVRWDWLLHSPNRFGIAPRDRKLTTVYDESFTSVAQLFCEAACTISQTDQFAVLPDMQHAGPGQECPNQWHLTAAFDPCRKNRILTVIQVTPSNTAASPIVREDGLFLCGDWKIGAELDPEKPAMLTASDSDLGILFNYGNEAPLIDGVPHAHRQAGTSILYDRVNGVLQFMEQSDYVQADTRTAF